MMNANRILVTGANGFVGKRLCTALLQQAFLVRALTRKKEHIESLQNSFGLPQTNLECFSDELTIAKDRGTSLHAIDTVVHLAARVHVMQDKAVNPLLEFRRINLTVTETLARQAAAAGVRRFIYLSSLKVNGEETAYSSANNYQSYSEKDIPKPQDPYGQSKWEAEQALHKISQETGLEIVIIRPPLVYGSGVKGNFSSLLKIITKGIPLPLASVKNLRSFIYVENLVDAIITCIIKPAAAGQTYFVSDAVPISTPRLIQEITNALNQPTRLLPFPPTLIRAFAAITGKSNAVQRLLGSLVIDSAKIQRELGWQPRYTIQEALHRDFAPRKQMHETIIC